MMQATALVARFLIEIFKLFYLPMYTVLYVDVCTQRETLVSANFCSVCVCVCVCMQMCTHMQRTEIGI